MHRLLFLVFGAAFLATLPGCDATSTTARDELVVQSYLVAGASLPPVRVVRSVPADRSYDAESAAVRGATVVVRRLGDDGQPRASYSYDEVAPGAYRPRTTGAVVAPGTRYRLEVQPPDGRPPIRATTTVPDTFEVVRVEHAEATYQDREAQPSITIRQHGDADARHILFTIERLDFDDTPEAELRGQLTRFYADVFDEEEDDIEDFRVSTSPIVNEAFFDRNDDAGTLTVSVPWIGIAFYGPNRVAINVMDDNLYDLLRTQEVQQGGLSPGEIPNVIEHVEGGTGVFGSYARQAVDIEVKPSEDP